MRRRFIIYLFSLLCAFIAFGLVLLHLFGVLNPAGQSIARTLDHQLENSVSDMAHDIDELAAYGISFSQQMGAFLERKLHELQMTSDDLNGNDNALNEIQSEAYALVYTNIQLAPCSGAFYILNNTANDAAEAETFSCLYLKFANLYSENTIHNKICLYRGDAATARNYNVNLHSAWQPEIEADAFSELLPLLHNTYENQDQYYLLTPVYRLTDTWEDARFLCVPIVDSYGQTMGVCGFEISDLYFQLSYEASEKEQKYMICALLDPVEGGYTGQLSANKSGYLPPEMNEILQVREEGGFIILENDDAAFVGKTQPLIVGESSHTVAAMLPQRQYDKIVREQQIKAILILLLILAAAVCSCIWLSKRYVHPILKGLEDIKSNQKNRVRSYVPEIDDLFDFLAKRDMDYEKQLERLADSKKKDIDPDAYEMFLSHLHTLTRKEREIFNLYLDGKSGKEILSIVNINQNTLKYHNRNLYSKLGVSSRKELLTYAAVMKQDEKAL